MRPLNPQYLALGALFWIATPATWMQEESSSKKVYNGTSFIVLLLEIKVERERCMWRKTRGDKGKLGSLMIPLELSSPKIKVNRKWQSEEWEGKIQRQRAKSKNITYLRLFQRITTLKTAGKEHTEIKRQRERILLTQWETAIEMATLPQGAVCWTLQNVKSSACHHWKRKHFHFINCLSKDPAPTSNPQISTVTTRAFRGRENTPFSLQC